MGAWGEKTFDDDTALDVIDEWMEAQDPEGTMEDALRAALQADYLEYTQGHAVSVAGALLDIVLNGQPNEELDLEGFDVWVSTLSRSRLEAMRPDVAAGLAKLISEESELNELWAENEELYPAWRKIHEDRRARLLVE